MKWFDVLDLGELQAARKALVRIGAQQVLLSCTPAGIAACPNRCPHEGYPLNEGDLSPDGKLRCNWHNWIFDLVSETTVIGGDTLVRFPVKVEGGRVIVGIEPPDPVEKRAGALVALPQALKDVDHQRIVREVARLIRADGDPDDAVRCALTWGAARWPFGTTHAIAGAADWLALADTATDPAQRLAAYGEVLTHIADDARADIRLPFAAGATVWDPGVFANAVEAQEEDTAVRCICGAFAAGATFDDVFDALAHAALGHYGGFGHSLIYTVKSRELGARLGPGVSEVLATLLVRSFVNATREDLLPEFRTYHEHLATWGNRTNAALEHPGFGGSARTAMRAVAARASEPPDAVLAALVDVALAQLLHADESAFSSATTALGDDAGWLTLTHALTFADAGREAALRVPALWPAVLLQVACFVGRNARHVDHRADVAQWMCDDADAFFQAAERSLFDHGRERFIISVHLVKTLTAGKRLVAAGIADPLHTASAVNRFINARMKGRHVIRTARQMHELVATEW